MRAGRLKRCPNDKARKEWAQHGKGSEASMRGPTSRALWAHLDISKNRATRPWYQRLRLRWPPSEDPAEPLCRVGLPGVCLRLKNTSC